jgi:hypothetical protein
MYVDCNSLSHYDSDISFAKKLFVFFVPFLSYIEIIKKLSCENIKKVKRQRSRACPKKKVSCERSKENEAAIVCQDSIKQNARREHGFL